jgi:hypothetical protein
MTLYPPALVREAFFHLCQTEGATPSGIASAYRADRSSIRLNWHYEAQRWIALDFRSDRGAEWFASFVGPMAKRPA